MAKKKDTVERLPMLTLLKSGTAARDEQDYLLYL